MRWLSLFIVLSINSALAQDDQFEAETLQRAVREQLTVAKTSGEEQLRGLQIERGVLLEQCDAYRDQYKQAFLFIHRLETDGTITWLQSAQEHAPEQVAAIQERIQEARKVQEQMKTQASSTGGELTELDAQISILEDEISTLQDLLAQEPQSGHDELSLPLPELYNYGTTGRQSYASGYRTSRRVSQIEVVFPPEFDSCPTD